MQRLKGPTKPYTEQTVSLGGKTYNLVYHFSGDTLDACWRIDIYNGQGVLVQGGVKVLPNSVLTPFYLNEMPHGFLACIRFNDSAGRITKDNLGVGLDYEIIFFLKSEV